MTTYYYYEPTGSFMNELTASQQIGSTVLCWCCERQKEIGLYYAYFDYGTPYNQYTQTLSGFTWTRFESLLELTEANPGAAERLTNSGEYVEAGPFYLQVWNVVELTGDAAIQATHSAKLVVGTEAARLLASVSGYANKNGCPDTITNYVAEILDLSNHPDFPYQLAQTATAGTFALWPTYPDLAPALESIADAPVATTNADVAFGRIIGSYSIPGSYPEKVTAITNAVAEYGVNGGVSDLYNFAVNELTS
jgi:hypothetical protein